MGACSLKAPILFFSLMPTLHELHSTMNGRRRGGGGKAASIPILVWALVLLIMADARKLHRQTASAGQAKTVGQLCVAARSEVES